MALILGEQEVTAGEIGVKYLRDRQDQVTIRADEVLDTVAGFFTNELT